MTRTALEKLNEQQLEYCKTISFIIDRARQNGLKPEFERASGKLRGFLECLLQMGIITGSDCKALYLWFFSENRHEKKTA